MIGGEIEIAPGERSPDDPGGDLDARMARTLQVEGRPHAWFASAREAVRWWATHLLPGGPVLLPAYGCESVVQPFREAGIDVRFYPVNRDLEVDPERIRTLARGCGAIQVIHYFGFPANPALFDLGVPVLEDAVQALLSPWARVRGQWAIASLRKFLPVPDGGLLVSSRAFDPPALPEARVLDPPTAAPPGPDRELSDVYGRKLLARMAKFRARRDGDVDAWWGAAADLELTEEELDERIVPRAMSRWSRAAVQGLDLARMAARRRKNYRTLFGLLFGRDPSSGAGPDRPDAGAPRTLSLRPLFDDLPESVVPYGLPILSERRDALMEYLVDQDIYTVIHWQLPPEIRRDDFPDSWWLFDRILTLPIDHRYGEVEMRAIARAVRAFEASS